QAIVGGPARYSNSDPSARASASALELVQPAHERLEPQDRAHVALLIRVLHRREQVRLLELAPLRLALEHRHVMRKDAGGIRLRAARDRIAHDGMQRIALIDRLLL